MAVTIDLTKREELGPAFEKVEHELGRVDILVNNAGNVSLSKGVMNETPEDWDCVLATQVDAVFLLSKIVAKGMLSRKKGKIIIIGSMNSFFGSGLIPRTVPRKERSSNSPNPWQWRPRQTIFK